MRKGSRSESEELQDFTLYCLGIGLISLFVASFGIVLPKQKTIIKTVKIVTDNMPDL